jgi:phage terminase small subunit
VAKRTMNSTKTTKPEGKLSARERLFCHEVVRCHGNQTKAAEAAGYSERSAGQIASRLMKKVKVRELIEKLNARVLEKVDAKAQEVLDELRHVAMARLSRVVKLHPGDSHRSVSIKPVEEWSEHELAALTKVDVEKIFDGSGQERIHVGDIVKLEMKGKQAALETLAKHHKLLVDKVEHSHSGEVRLVQDPYALPAEEEE